MRRDPGSSATARASNPRATKRSGRSSSRPPFPELISDLSKLPMGSHCLELFASEEEAADRAASFLAGAEDPKATSYWVADDRLVALNREHVARRDPRHEGNVHRLRGPQVVRREGVLRPTGEIIRFVRGHPEGVTGGAAAITGYWTREEIPAYLEYEEWFHRQARERSRFLCPYDLRKVPADLAAGVLPELARHHSHLVVSSVRQPASLLVQLLVFPSAGSVPKELRKVLNWAVREGLLGLEGHEKRPVLARKGVDLALAWQDFEEHFATVLADRT